MQHVTKRNGMTLGNCFCFIKHRAFRTWNRNRFGFSIRKLFGCQQLPCVRIGNSKTIIKCVFHFGLEIIVLKRTQCAHESPMGALFLECRTRVFNNKLIYWCLAAVWFWIACGNRRDFVKCRYCCNYHVISIISNFTKGQFVKIYCGILWKSDR